MPIPGVLQPELIEITPALRLRRFDGRFDFAFDWYQDPETVYLVDGVREPYAMQRLSAMYHYLDAHGELYFIEQLRGHAFVPIGDVTFWQDDIPIVIGDASVRGQGVGSLVVSALIERGRALGYPALHVREIYRWNEASRRMFEKLGFIPVAETEDGHSYQLQLA